MENCSKYLVFSSLDEPQNALEIYMRPSADFWSSSSISFTSVLAFFSWKRRMGLKPRVEMSVFHRFTVWSMQGYFSALCFFGKRPTNLWRDGVLTKNFWSLSFRGKHFAFASIHYQKRAEIVDVCFSTPWGVNF